MRNVIFSILVTLDGYIDHTAMIADDEIHQSAVDELNQAEMVLFGRRTYQLFAHDWPLMELDPGLSPGMLAFARRINSIPKIVFSRTLEKAEWNNSRLVKDDAVDYVAKLKQQPGGEIMVTGSTLANSLMPHNLIDEYRLWINPVILGGGQRLFRNDGKKMLKLIETRTFRSGVVILFYRPENDGSR